MKWIKIAIGAVIAILSISVITTTVYKMTQSREVIKEVSFEIDYNEGTYSPKSVYNDILEYGVYSDAPFNRVSNVIVYIDGEIAPNVSVIIDPNRIRLSGDLPESGIPDSYITDDGKWYDDGSSFNDNVVIKLVFDGVILPPQLTGTNATLILLIPIVFIGGVLLYFYKPLKKE